MELTRIKKQLAVAIKGHKLLKDKRDELMRQFLALIEQTKQLRQQVEESIIQANHSIALASAVMSHEALVSALMLPKHKISAQITTKSIMGIDVPVFGTQQNALDHADALSYGYAFTSGDLDRAVFGLADILPSLLELAQQEKTVQMLAAEIEKTRRRVNALEYVMIPNYRDTVRHITMKLDENERGSLTRLMKAKEIMMTNQQQK